MMVPRMPEHRDPEIQDDPADIDSVYRGVPALVMGGSGFIGCWTARALGARGAVVTVAARDAIAAARALGRPGRDMTIVQVDLADQAALRPLLLATRPSIVFNLAGYGVDASERDPAIMWTLNATLVEALVREVAALPADDWSGARLVHAGSALEYGPTRGALREDMVAEPTTAYGRAKLQATRALEAASGELSCRAVVARLFTVYGPGEHPHRLLPSLIRTARSGEPLPLTDGRQPRNFTYVEDAAEGLLRLGASDAPPGAVVNLATARLATVREFARAAAAVLEFDASLLLFGALPVRDEEMWHGEVDLARLRTLVAWIPETSVEDGIRRTRDRLDEN